MRSRREHQLHIWISRDCRDRLQVLAADDDTSMSELVRRVLLRFVRDRLAQSPAESRKIQATELVPNRYSLSVLGRHRYLGRQRSGVAEPLSRLTWPERWRRRGIFTTRVEDHFVLDASQHRTDLSELLSRLNRVVGFLA